MNLLLFCFPLRLKRVVCAVAALWLCSLGGVRAAPHVGASDDVLPSVQVTGTVVHLRAGPGYNTRRGQVVQGTALRVQGRSADDAWLAVAAPGGGTDVLWIYADLTDVGAQRYVLPWAGPPAVCTRSPDIQAALLTALAAQGRSRTCTTVTWADLAALTALPPAVDDYLWLWERHDLAGLTGLQEAQVVVTDAYAAAEGRLSGLAGLKRLDLQDACCVGVPWPSHFLAHAPQLQHLTLKVHTLQALPDHFLAYAPQLHTLDLTLEAHALQALPDRFLAHAPQLQPLTLKTHALQALPDHFLAYAPRLQHLTLTADGLTTLSDHFLTHAPQLHTLDLTLAYALQALPDRFLAHAPQLQSLTLTADKLTTLPDHFLAYAPRLQRLALHVPDLNVWPANLAITAEGLQTLELHNWDTLPPPAGWLAGTCVQDLTLSAPWAAEFLQYHAACLRNLDLEIGNWPGPVTRWPEHTLEDIPHLETFTLTAHHSLTTLSNRFLAHAPQLQRLTLEASDLTALPDRFLAHAPQLQRLTLRADGLTTLPDRFLAHAPQLQRLTLRADGLTTLPDRFLAHVPRLHTLELWLVVAALPADFLAHVPQLHTLDLYLYGNVTVLPDRFLARVPRLHTLSLWTSALTTTLPADFLAHASQLRTLDLHLNGNVTVLPDRFLAHVPRLHALSLWASEWTVLPDRFLAHAPHLHRLDWELENLTAIGDQVLTHAPQLETFVLNAPHLATVGEGFSPAPTACANCSS